MVRRPFLGLLLACSLAACGAKTLGEGEYGSGGRTAPAGPQVVFPTIAVDVELARTDAERAKGLGGHAPLAERQGMLFLFERPAIYPFWMKGMTFPLDIMWIEDGKVVHLEADLPPPGPRDTDQTLPIFTPPAAARYVLEVNAGFSVRHGIGLGTPAELRGV